MALSNIEGVVSCDTSLDVVVAQIRGVVFMVSHSVADSIYSCFYYYYYFDRLQSQIINLHQILPSKSSSFINRFHESCRHNCLLAVEMVFCGFMNLFELYTFFILQLWKFPWGNVEHIVPVIEPFCFKLLLGVEAVADVYVYLSQLFSYTFGQVVGSFSKRLSRKTMISVQFSKSICCQICKPCQSPPRYSE